MNTVFSGNAVVYLLKVGVKGFHRLLGRGEEGEEEGTV